MVGEEHLASMVSQTLVQPPCTAWQEVTGCFVPVIIEVPLQWVSGGHGEARGI